MFGSVWKTSKRTRTERFNSSSQHFSSESRGRTRSTRTLCYPRFTRARQQHMAERRISSALHFERDYRDPSSLAGYVVTDQIRGYLRRLSLGLQPNSGQRAWRITGDYGSGKSAFALLLAHVLGRLQSGAGRKSLRAIDVESLE